MGIGRNLESINEAAMRNRERKHMKATEQEAAAAAAVQDAILDELRAMKALHDRGCSRGLKPPVSSRDLAM